MHLAQSDDDAGRKRRSIERMSKCACVVRLRSAACTLPPFVPIVGLKHYHRVWFSREIRPKQPQGEREVQARPNFGTAGETSSHFDRHFLLLAVILLNIITLDFPSIHNYFQALCQIELNYSTPQLKTSSLGCHRFEKCIAPVSLSVRQLRARGSIPLERKWMRASERSQR